MKFKAMFFAIVILALAPITAWAVAAPANLTASAVSANTSVLQWDEDATVNQWYIYLGGVLRYQPTRADTSVPSTGKRSYLMQNLPNQSLIVVTMRAFAAGQPFSVLSSALTITASTVPITYVSNPPGQPILVSGTVVSSGGGDATAANQVIGNDFLGVIASSVTNTPTPKNVTVTALPGIDGAATQGFTWTQTPVAVNLSMAAGTAGKKYLVYVNNYGPCAAADVDVAFGVTSTAFIHGSIPSPNYIPLSITGGVAYGPYVEGIHILGKSLSSSNCVGSYRVETAP